MSRVAVWCIASVYIMGFGSEVVSYVWLLLYCKIPIVAIWRPRIELNIEMII